MSIVIEHVSKRFDDIEVLNDVNLEVWPGELIALLGPSGCGKTTLLRILAGLDHPDTGRISVNGVEVTNQHISKRRVGFVFQHYALFRHLSVADNVAFGLTVLPRAERPPSQQIQSKVQELLALVQLQDMANRYPAQLSGGQRQRVALARALAVEPKLLLLDEPFGALDAKVRKELRRWIRRLHDELQVTSILVTHDQEEALEITDRVVVMHQGRIEQVGTPDEVYEHPITPFVCHFLGDVNIFHCRVPHCHLDLQQKDSGQDFPPQLTEGEEVTFVRPHELALKRTRSSSYEWEATVRYIVTAGARVHIELIASNTNQIIDVELTKERYRDLRLNEDEVVYVHPKQLQVFRAPIPVPL
ncbi:sulfate/thiosulfate import ATP-binding protein CysA [Nitrospira sp. KM1]|uniref:sulfate/molybdate ABC transporter ATP-binding protein n=1 Tax=Nitrospira sp. KM1 TaxID=1936990 RepID=UPI0013A7A065|nr:sulfate ABC transporter ATP-binding protein [Nitrospira sp. KM1]BCA53372.1 sulfate/thiosulfate import ATP-binding protein CysA [Nitrospira sp. KM1]